MDKMLESTVTHETIDERRCLELDPTAPHGNIR